MKLWSGYKSNLTAEDKDFVVATTLSLQIDHDRWLYDPTYRMEEEARRAKEEQEIQKLIALGHTPREAVDILFPRNGRTPEQRG